MSGLWWDIATAFLVFVAIIMFGNILLMEQGYSIRLPTDCNLEGISCSCWVVLVEYVIHRKN